jgi:hypothetical protein
MAGLVPAIDAFIHGPKNVDARDEPGHDDVWCAELAAISVGPWGRRRGCRGAG